MRPRRDIDGQTFGQLVCEGYAGVGEQYGRRVHLWHFRCSCGTRFTDVSKDIRAGKKSSCGCKQREARQNLGKWTDKLSDLTGQEFGRLTVREKAGTNEHRQRLWLCDCVCGGTRLTTRHSLEHHKVWSCGCAVKDQSLAALEKAREANRLKAAAYNSPLLRGLFKPKYVRPRAASTTHILKDE